MTGQAFSEAERRAVYRAIFSRRDMRRFITGTTVPTEVLARIPAAAHAAPSVGLMQPWRFIRITDTLLRNHIHALASAACAIENVWLAARAEGLGVGWVSIFEPTQLAGLLGIPDDAEPIAILCIGEVPEFPDRPQLEIDHWAVGRPLSEFVFENGWG